MSLLSRWHLKVKFFDCSTASTSQYDLYILHRGIMPWNGELRKSWFQICLEFMPVILGIHLSVLHYEATLQDKKRGLFAWALADSAGEACFEFRRDYVHHCHWKCPSQNSSNQSKALHTIMTYWISSASSGNESAYLVYVLHSDATLYRS